VSRKSFHPCSTELRALFLELQQARMESAIRGGIRKFPHILSTPAATVIFGVCLSMSSDSTLYLPAWLKTLQLRVSVGCRFKQTGRIEGLP